ncbi:MAG: 2'-5' RNA ligase family protein [Cyclobacteriaceae bacterium]
MKECLYFLAIVPPEPIYTEVAQLKQLVFDQFESKAALRSPPHITLHMPFKWKESKEEKLLNSLINFEMSSAPFTVELSNFDFFPPKVVFVDVMPDAQLAELQSKLVKHVRLELNLFNADYKDKPFHPHMTIAFRDLKKNVFLSAKDYFSEQSYNAEFIVDGYHLLKHDGKKWNSYRAFKCFGG